MAYRTETGHAPLARVVGRELHVATGGRLPRVCATCGGTRDLKERVNVLHWHPTGGLLHLLVGTWIGEKLKRTARVTFSVCKGCDARAKNARDTRGPIGVGVAVLGLAAATAGLNGYPAMGIALAAATAVAGLATIRAVSGREVRAVHIHSDGTVALRGVHANAARAAVENRTDAAGHDLDPTSNEAR